MLNIHGENGSVHKSQSICKTTFTRDMTREDLRILQLGLKFHHYKMQVVQFLKATD